MQGWQGRSTALSMLPSRHSHSPLTWAALGKGDTCSVCHIPSPTALNHLWTEQDISWTNSRMSTLHEWRIWFPAPAWAAENRSPRACGFRERSQTSVKNCIPPQVICQHNLSLGFLHLTRDILYFLSVNLSTLTHLHHVHTQVSVQSSCYYYILYTIT